MSHAPHPEMVPILADMLAPGQPDYTKMPLGEARTLFTRNYAVWNTPMPDGARARR